MDLHPKVLEWLEDSAISPDVALTAGGLVMCSSLEGWEGEPIPPGFEGYPGLVSALAFRWTDGEGRFETQLKPWPHPLQLRSGPAKYVWRKGMVPVVNLARAMPGATVLLVEGTKQHLAAASWAPLELEVRGLAGCRMWDSASLGWADGRSVVVVLDADAADNPDVYDAGVRLAEALRLEGAADVKFARIPGTEKQGLDDVLAARPVEKRTQFVGRLVAAAKVKPADKRPTKKARAASQETDTDRPTLDVGQDKLKVILGLQDALRALDGDTLFHHGPVLSKRVGTKLQPVSKDSFHRVLADVARTVAVNTKGEDVPAWPDAGCQAAVLSEPEVFTPLDKISTIPFVRPDGSIRTEPGYDEATRIFLELTDDVAGLEVPAEPTPEDVGEALGLLTDHLLVDFPFPTDADRAGALALLLTPFIRHLVPLVPLCIVDGKEAGSGKNLLADCLATIVTGRPADPLPYTTDDEEHRKVITSAFRTGASLFVFDEAHSIEGTSFARAITSVTYTDRVLGGSNMGEFPNRITWVSLGNQVEVKGDMSRRVHRVSISYDGESPENRDGFLHPDLRAWTEENRRELVRALLVLVRAWFAAGQPPARLTPMGSFERWQKVVGGILVHAGVTGFLEGLKTWRSESDHTRTYWASHVRWLKEEFGDKPFTTAQVVKRLLEDETAEWPGFDFKATEPRNMPRVLGQQYARTAGRWLDGRRLVKDAVVRHTITWKVEEPGGEGQRGVSAPDTLPEQPKRKSTQPKSEQKDPVRTGGTPNPTRVEFSSITRTRDTRISGGGAEVPPVLTTHTPVTDSLLAQHAGRRKPAPCPTCMNAMELTPPSFIWAACRHCHPASFSV